MMQWQYLSILTVVTIIAAETIPLSSRLKLTATKQLCTQLVECAESDSSFSTSVLAENIEGSTVKTKPPGLIQQLELTEAQRQEIEQIHRQYRKRILQRKKDLDLLQQQLADMMAGDASIDSIRAKNQELVMLRQEIGELRFESMLATREVLSLEQRRKFREFVESIQHDRAKKSKLN